MTINVDRILDELIFNTKIFREFLKEIISEYRSTKKGKLHDKLKKYNKICFYNIKTTT